MILEFLIALLVVLLKTALLYRRRRGTRPFEHSYVVITGCDLGFGRLAAERFDSLGMHVFAGCLLDKSIKELKKKCSDNITVVKLDITNQSDIGNLLIQVKEKLPAGKGLTGLINNAGVAGSIGLTESLGSEHYLLTFKANFFGMVDVTKALIPLLRKGKGRIINTSSTAGKFSAPFAAPYFASKHALESYSDSLRRELYHDDISVHIIEPGIFKTGILNKHRTEEESVRYFRILPPESREFYGMDTINKIDKIIENGTADADRNLGKVVDSYQHALMSSYPKIRYKVGMHAQVLIPIVNYLPEWLIDAFIGTQIPVPSGVSKT